MQSTSLRSRSGPRSSGLPLVGVLTTVVLVSTVNVVFVVPLIGRISAGLHTSTTNAVWTLIVVTLASGVSIPIFGRLGDAYGHRRALLCSAALILVATIVCAAAHSIAVLMAGRLLLGVAAGAFPAVLGLIRTSAPQDRIRLYTGLVVAGEGAGVGAGYLYGGLFQSHSVNSAFWVLAVLEGVCLVGVVLFAPENAELRTPARLDLVGAFLLITGSIAVLLVLSEANTWGWVSIRSGVTLAVGLAAVFSWIRWESRQGQPLVDLATLRSPAFVSASAAGFFVGVAVGGILLVFVSYAEVPHAIAGYGYSASPLVAGTYLIPNAVCVLVLAPLAGGVAHRWGARRVLAVGTGMLVVAFGFLAIGDRPGWQMYVGSALCGSAVACALTGMYAWVGDMAARGRQGENQAFNSLIYSVGSAAGSALTSAILTAQLIRHTALPTDASYTRAFLIYALAGTCALAATIGYSALVGRAHSARTGAFPRRAPEAAEPTRLR